MTITTAAEAAQAKSNHYAVAAWVGLECVYTARTKPQERTLKELMRAATRPWFETATATELAANFSDGFACKWYEDTKNMRLVYVVLAREHMKGTD